MGVRLTFYGGTGCIGGNKILLEDGDSVLLFDFGTDFKAEGMYFDEFLGPRTTFGFSDLLSLGILPPLKNLYRCDLEYPGVWEKCSRHPLFREVEAQAVLLSHAHYDHCGYVSYLREDIPVFASLASACICKALQDTSKGGAKGEVCYAVPHELRDGLIRTVKSARTRPAPARQRPYRAFGCAELGADARAFWERCDSSRGLCSTPMEALGGEGKVAGLRVRFWPVDHSVPGAAAFAVETSAGWVVYTGDLRLHGKKAHLTRQFVDEAAKLRPAVLICEGTHPEVEKPVTEEEVAANCFEVVKKADGLVVADFGPRNVERLLSFLEIAEQTGRLLVLTPKDVYLLEALRASGGPGVPDPYADGRVALYARPKAQRDRWEDAVLARFGERAPERLVDAAGVKADPGGYILCFSYYDFHALLDIEPRGGTYIYSSSEAFNEEMLVDHRRVQNWIDFFGFTLYGNLGEDREKSGFHASGHAHGPGIEELVDTVRPEVLVPVHTESPGFFRRFEGLTRVVAPTRGEMVEFG